MTVNSLVVTGGTSGIGLSVAKLALQQGYQVVVGGTRDRSAVDQDLLAHSNAHFVQVHVEDRNSMLNFTSESMKFLGPEPEDLTVVACAGVSKRGDLRKPEDREAIHEMRRINIDGTKMLAYQFADPMRRAQRAVFVGLSSIVAAEGRAVKTDEHYMYTKGEVQAFVTVDMPLDPRLETVQSFAVAPGVVPTPMTRGEAIIPQVFRGAMIEAALNTEFSSIIRSGLSVFSGEPETAFLTPALSVQTLLGSTLATLSEKKQRRFADVLVKDPALTGRGAAWLKSLKENEEPAVLDRIIEVLYALDLAVTPDYVADRLLNQLASRQMPLKGLLKVYSKEGNGETDTILDLLHHL